MGAALDPTMAPAPSARVGPTGAHPAFTVAMRWTAILFGLVFTMTTAKNVGPVLTGLPLLFFALLRTAEGYVTILRPGWIATISLITELAAAAAIVAGTGGWHSGWVVTLVIEAGVVGYSLPYRHTGQVAAAVVICMFLADLMLSSRISSNLRSSLNLDCLLLVAALAVSYATWLTRFGDADRARLVRTNERLMATNDLLLLLEQIVLKGEDATDPIHAARAVARLTGELLHPDSIVVASAASVGDTWRVLLAEGTTVPALVDDVAVFRRVRGEAALGAARPSRLIPEMENLDPTSAGGVCIPLTVRSRLIGAVVLESVEAGRWSERDLEMMEQISPWAALLIDNACRFNSLWVVGSAEERARVARTLHDSLGQNMAALGLQLDWIARTSKDQEQTDRIRELRQSVTAMVGELRFTMRDLCTDVSDERSLAEALRQLAQQVSGRSGIDISLKMVEETRLSVAQEHQVLQMARSLIGAAVDSRAGLVEVSWYAGPHDATLEVAYDNPAGSLGAAAGGRYENEAPIVLAVAEVRDRCWAVGGNIETEMERDKCKVRCRLSPSNNHSNNHSNSHSNGHSNRHV
jgi:signal transduction histidine kinase